MKKIFLYALSFLLIAVALVPAKVHADTATITPTDDAFISSYYPTGNWGSSSYIYIGNTPSTGAIRYVLVKFSLSSLPSNANINSATLRLYRSGGSAGGPFSIGLWRLTSNWNESTVAWGTRPSEVTTGIFSSIDTSVGYKTWTVTDIAKAWKNGTYTNQGFRVGFTGSSSDWQIDFHSKEGANDPQLVVDYTVPDTTAPTISATAVSEITSSGAKVTWTTNEASDSWVDYGTAVSYGSTTGQSDNVTSHTVTLGSLSAGTTYHYRVRSKDSSGNSATSVDGTFTTSAAAEPSSPAPATPAPAAPPAGTTTPSQPAPTPGNTTPPATSDGSGIEKATETATPSSKAAAATDSSDKKTPTSGNQTMNMLIAIIVILLLVVGALVLVLLKKRTPKVVEPNKPTEPAKKEENSEVKSETENK